MRILQIIQRSQLRGAEIFACQLSEQLQNQGHQVDMLVLFGEKSSVFAFPLAFHFLEADEKSRWFDFKGYKKLSNFIKSGNYDIVQANAGDTLKYATLSRKLFGWKSTLVFRNANKISDFLKSLVKRKLNTWLMKEVDYVASVSEECMIDFKSTFPSFEQRIATLPIGVKTELALPYSSLNDIGINGEGPFIINVAGFVPEKNHVGLIKIFSKILVSFPTAKLLLVGEGKLKDSIAQLVDEMQIKDSVIFLGRRNDVLKIMGCCHAFVLPSLIEGLPAVILEAFTKKIPVVAYNIGGIKEIVINNKTGWLIEKNNEDEFIAALNESLSKPTEQIKNSAYALAVEEYAIEVIALKFIKFYKQSLS